MRAPAAARAAAEGSGRPGRVEEGGRRRGRVDRGAGWMEAGRMEAGRMEARTSELHLILPLCSVLPSPLADWLWPSFPEKSVSIP